MEEAQPYRLPETVVPERYEIRLAPDFSRFTFDGSETVLVHVKEPVKEIMLNACELAISSVSAADSYGTDLAGNARIDEANERALLTFSDTLRPGQWRLNLGFSGILNDKLHGFYRGTYKDTTGRSRTLASTQFEATDARRAFPCWDEPALKAVFQVTLVIDKELLAISNTAVLSETPLAGTDKKEVRFADTIRMSTYLVAFIVGEFEPTEPAFVDGAPLRVWAVPGKSNIGKYAREIGSFSLSFFSGYYGRRYPGDKLDLIAIPDFASGAMENLGAITFRETALLVDEARASRGELERVADVVSHENAHMWFGDLVTMRWWNGLWLNEAFATFMEMLAVDAWRPEWKRWTTFTVSRAAALLVDGLTSTRPIEFPVERPEDAAGMFDVLTYEKGAAVLRMLEQYLGADVFRDGIRLYLRKHEYGNAETTDLWDAIEESAGQPVREVMDSWIFQPGYPLVTVEMHSGKAILSQRIFRYLGGEQDIERQWQIPVHLRVQTQGGSVERNVLLTGEKLTIDLPATDWLVVNAGGNGFFRTKYAPPLLQRLTVNLETSLSAVERFNLLSDTWATTLAGITDLADFLDLLKLFGNERNLNVWTAILGACHYLNRLFEPDQRLGLQGFVRDLAKPVLERLGWQPMGGESELTSQLRGELISALGTLGEDRAVQVEAQSLYRKYKQDRGAVDRNVVPALVSIVAHAGGAAEYEELRACSKSAETPQEEQRYLFALAHFRPAELVEKTLASTINNEVRTQNAPYLVRTLLFNVHGRERTWEFMKEHWEEMLRQYPENSIVRMCEGVTALVSRELEADVKAFFAAHPVKQGRRTLEQHMEKLRIAVAAKERWSVGLGGLQH